MIRFCTVMLSLLVSCLGSAGAAPLLLIEDESSLPSVARWDPGAMLLFEGADYLVVAADQPLNGAAHYEVLDPAYSENSNLVVAFPTTAEGRARVEALGQVLLRRGDVWLIRLADTVPSSFNLQGVLGVIPLKPRLVASLAAPADSEPGTTGGGREGAWQWLVDEVSETAYKNTIQTLEDFVTRNARTTEFYDACLWAQSTFESYGLQAEIQEFWADAWWGTDFTCWNVVAEQPGVDAPDQIYIVCGHLDSTAGNTTVPETVAPGADDNASGSGGVLEAARVLAQHDFLYTIRYICFGAEEMGLCGSYVYAENAAQSGEQIIGVINMDMLLFDLDADMGVYVPYDGQSEWLAQAFYDACADYVPGLQVQIDYNPSAAYSDHYPFWVNGFPALEVIEDDLSSNPHYHSTTDLLANYEDHFPFGTRCLKGAVATIVELAGYTFVDAVDDDPHAPGSALSLKLSGANPARERIGLALAQPAAGPVSIALTDVLGRALWRSSSTVPPDGAELSLRVDHFPAGVYWVRAASATATAATRVLIVR